MAGNVREWTWNASGTARYILGGAWDSPAYMFFEADTRPPMDRSATNGLRLASYAEDPEALSALMEPVETAVFDYRGIEPVSDDVFEGYKASYAYDHGPLAGSIDATDDTSPYWTHETVSIDAAYGDERLIVHLFLPRGIDPPYQAIMHFPGAGSIFNREPVQSPRFPELVQGGRAFVWPEYRGTRQRGTDLSQWRPEATVAYARHMRQWVQDFSRTLDYLETREEIDESNVGYLGTNWGSNVAPVILALEPRIRAAVLYIGGFPPTEARAEASPVNFAPRVRMPVLMINGTQDFIFPLERSSRPLFNAIGSEDKDLIVHEGGHGAGFPVDQVIRDMREWFDQHLGPVR